MTRQHFIMTQADYDKLLESMKPVPAILLQCGPPLSVQENANRAWKELGDRMGFDHMSVEPTSQYHPLEFTAEPKVISPV